MFHHPGIVHLTEKLWATICVKNLDKCMIGFYAAQWIKRRLNISFLGIGLQGGQICIGIAEFAVTFEC